MELYLKNVGRIKNTVISIDGLTVICGDNNTGKSTIGKVLYCIYKSFYQIQEKVRKEKIASIRRGISIYYNNFLNRHIVFSRRSFDQHIYEISEQIIDNSEFTLDRFISYMNELYGDETLSNAEIKETYRLVQNILNMEENEVLAGFLKRYLDAEFGLKLGNVNHPERETDVRLSFRKEGEICFGTKSEEQEILLERVISLNKKIIYLDDPFLLDDMNEKFLPRFATSYTHRSDLLRLLRSERDSSTTMVEAILQGKKIKELERKFNEISSGNIVFHDGKYEYKSTKLRENMDLVSLSTGIKSFAILKKLLGDGMIEENGILVIDEPEVHLHPEWQMKYAEIVVMLQKEYSLNIILATHSIDFLSALMFYAKLYKIEDVFNSYLAVVDPEDESDLPDIDFVEVNEDSERLYDSLSAPFLELYAKENELLEET